MKAAAALAGLLLGLAAACANAETPKKKSATPNRFGAIAYHAASQSWGVGYDFARARDANEQALQQCINPRCEVVHKFRNGCGALAVDAKHFAAASGTTRAEAETKAERRCNEKARGQTCNVLAWGCTR